jgi:hypothetical protein
MARRTSDGVVCRQSFVIEQYAAERGSRIRNRVVARSVVRSSDAPTSAASVAEVSRQRHIRIFKQNRWKIRLSNTCKRRCNDIDVRLIVRLIGIGTRCPRIRDLARTIILDEVGNIRRRQILPTTSGQAYEYRGSKCDISTGTASLK